MGLNARGDVAPDLDITIVPVITPTGTDVSPLSPNRVSMATKSQQPQDIHKLNKKVFFCYSSRGFRFIKND